MALISRRRSAANEEKAAENQPELDLQTANPSLPENENTDSTVAEEKNAKVVRRRRIVVKSENTSEEAETAEKQPESYESANIASEPASFDSNEQNVVEGGPESDSGDNQSGE